jgi:hypothetical protein
MIRKISLIFTIVFFVSGVSSAQVITGTEKNKDLNPGSGNLILGFFNPKNLTMNHSFQMSTFLSPGGNNVTLTSYINSLNYKVSDRFNVSADVKMQYAPFASSQFGPKHASIVQENLSGMFLSRASIDYKLSENSHIRFEYRRIDESNYLDYYNPFRRDQGLFDSTWR